MAIKDSVSLIAIIILYSPAVFTLNILLQFYWQLHLSTLLAPKRVQKAQHRENQSLSPLLANFRIRKYPSFVVRLPATFP